MGKLEEIINEKCTDGTISCEEALSIAKDLGIPAKDVGSKLNEMDIKINSCQLGCFP